MILIETERLRLRRLERKDAPRLAEYRSHAEVARYQSWESMTVEEGEAFIDSLPERPLAAIDEWSQLAIADKTSDALIGDIGLCRHAPGNVVEIGFTLSPSVQGRGLAAEACRVAIEWVFSVPEIEGIRAVIDTRNTPAIALVERLGMAFDHAEPAEFKGASCTEAHFELRRVRPGNST